MHTIEGNAGGEHDPGYGPYIRKGVSLRARHEDARKPTTTQSGGGKRV